MYFHTVPKVQFNTNILPTTWYSKQHLLMLFAEQVGVVVTPDL
jgi:hypothetical protein